MNEKISNLCWEFCYEFIPAQFDNNGSPHVLILNAPVVFQRELEKRLLNLNFFCSRTIPHGSSAILMQFKKVGLPIQN